MLDIQNLCLDKRGPTTSQSVGGAPSGEETLVQAKRCLELARAKGLTVNWSMWGMDPGGHDIGLWGEKYPYWKKPDSPFNHGTFDGALCDGFVPARGRGGSAQAPQQQLLRVAAELLAEARPTRSTWSSSARRRATACRRRRATDSSSATRYRGCATLVPRSRSTGTDATRRHDHEVPEGYGQYWEGLRNMQAQYADVVTTDEFLAFIEASR